MSFPRDFVWGAAAAAYQIEGGAFADGKGPSIWDMFCRSEGAVFEGHSGEVACDHYHRWPEDVAIMRQMGLKAYRLSISWARVLPEGTGRINEPGLAFYDRLIDALLDAGITPYITLFHWDYPYALYCRGGWLNPRSPQWFADYARIVAERLSDRVRHWITLNEPQVFLNMGHRQGIHAPGLKLPWTDLLRAAHHALLAHGRAVQALRETCRSGPSIGWAPVGVVHYPAGDSAADVDAARSATWSADGRSIWNNALFSDPVCLGHYPEDALRAWGRDMPTISPEDLRTIAQPIDFYGVNIYSGHPVRAGDDGKPIPTPRPPGYPVTSMHWPVDEPSLYWGPRFIHERYRLPVVITENGMANNDWIRDDASAGDRPAREGSGADASAPSHHILSADDAIVEDPQRIDFLRRYLRALKRAIDDGADVRGYFYWSILDNFEWAEGYKQRFGLIYVDYPTQRRVPKSSAHWYAQLIRTNGQSLPHP